VNSQTKSFLDIEKGAAWKTLNYSFPVGDEIAFRDKEDFFQIPRPGRLRINSRLEGIRKNGEKVELDISLSPLQIGKEIYAWVAVRDTTERQQVEDNSKVIVAYTRSLIEASLNPLVMISPAGKITDVNEALVEATGVAREILIGTEFSDYFTNKRRRNRISGSICQKVSWQIFPLP